MALAIMFYHIVGWKFEHPEAGSLLGNFGVYGVSVFFVLSGLSMAIVYNNFIKDARSSLIFFVRRLFRLLPLLWVAVAIQTFLNFWVGENVDIIQILLNITLFFGFFEPDAAINLGAWSIGNEAVYYALTPLLIMLYAKNKLMGNLAVAISILIALYFAFYLINLNSAYEEQWSTYQNPFNNLFLYACGIALYYNFHNVNLARFAPIIILLAFLTLVYYPVAGDQLLIITDINRVILSFASVALTLGFYKIDIKLPSALSTLLAKLGEATYGVYLLHPIVFVFVNQVFEQPLLCVIITSLATIVIANFSYKFYEKPFIKLGKRITA